MSGTSDDRPAGSTTNPAWLVGHESVASPSQLRPREPGDVRWYLPTWGERLQLMGWRNILWVPSILLIAFLISSLAFGHLFWLGLTWWKPLAVLIGLPVSLAMGGVRGALKHRTDPFCIHCGYSLVGLAEGYPCPECGEATSHALCREYQRDPHWFIERYRTRHALPPADAPFEAGEHRVAGDGT